MPVLTPPPPAPAARFTAPLQPWTSPDGRVRLLRPSAATPSRSDAPLGALASPGWRLLWNGASPTPGRLVVRLTLPIAPAPPLRTAREGLQVGVSRAPEAVRTCLTYGLEGAPGRRLPDRTINGRRYAAWTHADAGMSQSVTATDLRTVAGGACWAVARFRYGESASERDPSVTLAPARGQAEMNAALASLRLGPGPAPQPPALRPPPGAVAR